ncbi:MAG: hypothetical protein ACR2QC_11680, partial [Gammaproteobacteria bacterium]
MPPFRRKPESPRRRREITRRFAAAEIPAFAGMGQKWKFFSSAGFCYNSAMPNIKVLPHEELCPEGLNLSCDSG